jgi:flavodoxin
MKTIIVYDSVFGNTEKIAKTMAQSIENQCEIKITHINQLQLKDLQDINLLIIGSPTRGFEPTKPIAEALRKIKVKDYPFLMVAVFDTRIDVVKINNIILNIFVKFCGYAVDTMEKIVRNNSLRLVGEGKGFFVEESEGPLRVDETNKAAQWVRDIVAAAN